MPSISFDQIHREVAAHWAAEAEQTEPSRSASPRRRLPWRPAAVSSASCERFPPMTGPRSSPPSLVICAMSSPSWQPEPERAGSAR